jgi:exopolysaccharide biosynthesis polyprenyl glycosylphosphotransferase
VDAFTGGGTARVEVSMREFPNLEDVDASPRVAATAGAALDVSDVGLTRWVELTAIDGGRSGARPAWISGGLLDAAGWQVVVKRAADLIGGVLLLTLLLPIMLIAAMLVRVTSPGPALYVQKRIGKDGRPFRMYKFRSMRRGAHLTREELRNLNEVSGPVFKIRRDPRITPVGRWLRRLSIDELPQLINVLRGEMSLVGPRPPLLEEYVTYSQRERERLSVKPGLTCIWQVSGRSDLDFRTWVEMDLEYIANWSLRRDVRILLLTIPAVFSGRGAY